MPEIEDIVETTERAPLLLTWQWLLIAIFCLLIIYAIITYLSKQKNTYTKPNNLKNALLRLKEIQQTANEHDQDSNELSIELSLLTRQYLQGQFQNKSIFQTHQEFIADHEDLEKLPGPAREKLASYLSDLANHKYSPNPNLPEEKNKLIQLTASLLKGIDSTISKNIN